MRLCKYIVVAVLSLIFSAACVTSGGGTSASVDNEKALEAHIKLGMNYLQRDDRDRAQRAFAKAQEIDPRSAEAMQGIALVHQLNGEAELAEKKFQKALKLRADFSASSIEFSYARFLYSEKRYKEAIRLLKNASQDINYPSRVNALYFLGLSSLKVDNKARAKASFEHALNINERFALAALELASLNFEDQDYPNAKKYLDIYDKNARQSARSLWLGIRLEKVFDNKDKIASYVLALKNRFPYSKEYLAYKESIKTTKK